MRFRAEDRRSLTTGEPCFNLTLSSQAPVSRFRAQEANNLIRSRKPPSHSIATPASCHFIQRACATPRKSVYCALVSICGPQRQLMETAGSSRWLRQMIRRYCRYVGPIVFRNCFESDGAGQQVQAGSTHPEGTASLSKRSAACRARARASFFLT